MKNLKIKAEIEYQIKIFRVDIFLKSKKTVIELNGRYHYVSDRYAGTYFIKK